MGGNYGGIYPQFTKNIIGFRYGFQRFNHPNTDFNFNGSSKVRYDEFHTYEVWGRFYPHPKVQLFAFVPYKQHIREESERTTVLSGVGDISLMANYTFFNTADSVGGPWKHALLLGGGVKLPTGDYMQRDDRLTTLPAQFQIGTGAYSFIANANYTVRYKQWGLNADYTYRLNGENERTYRFGDQQVATANLFYTYSVPGYALLPNAGLSYEYYAVDKEFGREKDQTGGELFLANVGVDAYFDRFFFRITAQMPLRQKLPEAQPAAKVRYNLGLAYTF
jgi:hypothetical protein